MIKVIGRESKFYRNLQTKKTSFISSRIFVVSMQIRDKEFMGRVG
jgi:hypothetical protein